MPQKGPEEDETTSERKLFKDWFNQELVTELGERLVATAGKNRFDFQRFRDACAELEPLGMSGRVGLVAGDEDVHVVSFSLSPTRCGIGDTVTLTATVENRGRQEVDGRIDFAMTSPTKTRKDSRKVFRWADRRLAPGEVVTVETRHAFVHRTIRTVHRGRHRFEVLVNGAASGEGAVAVEG